MEARSEASAEDRRTILVIDDDPQTFALLGSWFRGRPYDLEAAENGTVGLERVRSLKPDVVVLDLKMPGPDGLSVARTLKDDPETRAIPVILLTACRGVDDKVAAFAAGADDYVTKPFDFEEMDARIQAMIRRGDLLSGLQSTIRNLKSTNSELEHLLTLDEKTGLHNFREFRRKLRDEWSRAERYGAPLSLVMLDIDDFSRFNNTWGHPAGDRALQEFATLVAGGARASDTAARYGGEEFAVVLPHTDADMAARVAERIRAAVAEFEFVVDDRTVHVTVSAGVATYPASAGVDSVDLLVRVADQALYEAKKRGKNRVVRAPARTGDHPGGVDRRRSSSPIDSHEPA